MHTFIFAAVTTFLLLGCSQASVATRATPGAAACSPAQAAACRACEAALCRASPPPQELAAPAQDSTEAEGELTLIGETEWALVEPGGLVLEARIDTGAATSSIHAEDIELIERTGKRWVSFALRDPASGDKIPVERRLHRRILVKQKTEESDDRRYVVRMWVTLGTIRVWLDVSLSDRDDFEFPLLIGRNMLREHFVVDVTRQHALGQPIPQTEEE